MEEVGGWVGRGGVGGGMGEWAGGQTGGRAGGHQGWGQGPWRGGVRGKVGVWGGQTPETGDVDREQAAMVLVDNPDHALQNVVGPRRNTANTCLTHTHT